MNPDYVHFSPLLEALLKTALFHPIPSCFTESTSLLAIYSTVCDQSSARLKSAFRNQYSAFAKVREATWFVMRSDSDVCSFLYFQAL